MVRLINAPNFPVGAFVFGLALWYFSAPLGLRRLIEDPYLTTLAGMTALAIVAVLAGFKVPWLDSRFSPNAARLRIPERSFQVFVWGPFLIFATIVIATAPSIPLVSSLMGVSEVELSVERGEFLKTRTGWQAMLPYVSTVFVGALLPYATGRLFIHRHPLRFAALGAFLLYTLLALEKVAFIFALGPLLWLFLRHARYGAAAGAAVAALCILYANTVLARGLVQEIGIASVEQSDRRKKSTRAPPPPGTGNPLTARYVPKNAIDHLLTRAFIIPVVTAGDALRVFDQKFEGRHLWGATSSFVAKVTGQQSVNYDAEVFAYQYGKSEIGRSNVVYLIEAYVNFGWLGIVAFSLFVGQALRWFHKTTDEALHIMWPLFCLFVFSAGLIGTLLSNGYAAVFALALFGCVGAQRTEQ